MSVEVDDLFKGGEAPPPADPRPRLRRMASVGAMGHVLGVFAGMAAMLVAQVAQQAVTQVAPNNLQLGVDPGPILTVLFLAYLVVVPATLLSLYAWHRSGEELDRVKRGILPREWAGDLRGMRRALLVWLGVCALSMSAQTALLGWMAAGATR